jgi:hypothetical protein
MTQKILIYTCESNAEMMGVDMILTTVFKLFEHCQYLLGLSTHYIISEMQGIAGAARTWV